MANGKLIFSFRVRLFVDTRPRRPDKVAPRFDRLTLRKRPRRNVLREPNGMRLIILYSLSRLGWRLVLSPHRRRFAGCRRPQLAYATGLAIDGFSAQRIPILGGRSDGSTSSMVGASWNDLAVRASDVARLLQEEGIEEDKGLMIDIEQFSAKLSKSASQPDCGSGSPGRRSRREGQTGGLPGRT